MGVFQKRGVGSAIALVGLVFAFLFASTSGLVGAASADACYPVVTTGACNCTASSITTTAANIEFAQGDFCLLSTNGLYMATFQTDGNFVVYQIENPQPFVFKNVALWSSQTAKKTPSFFDAQSDGNFVIYQTTASKNIPIWSTNTFGHDGDVMVMQTDGNLVVYQGNTPLWSTNTAGE